MPRSLVLLAAAVLAVSALAVPTGAQSSEAVFLVGYDRDESQQAHLAIQLAGGNVERASAELGFSVVTTSDANTFLMVADASPWIDYVETDDRIALAGGQWNGGQWNGAQWNGAQWNGGQWNGGQWNGGQWNAQWNKWSSAQQNATLWTIEHFDAPTGWTYDLEVSDPGLVWQWGVWAIDGVATTSEGSATLCVLDSGVAWDHPDIAPRYASGWNAIDPLASAYDDAGHGTHIAGIAAAQAGNAFGTAGVAEVDILNVKVLDSEGYGDESDLAFGLEWCAKRGASVAVMALSATDDGPTMDRALQYAADHDVLLLASAGNDAGPVAFPANDRRVVAVSAVDGDLALAPFSNRGDDIELAAPGVHALGPFPGGGFAFGSGTSQAVAYAAGVAAFLRDARADLSAEEARQQLASSSLDIGPPGPDPSFGHGLVSMHAIR